MARIDRVIEFLEQQFKKGMGGISAQQVALELGIHRSDASADLNRLFKQHIVDKLGTRPVLYQLKKEHVAPFNINKAVEAERKKAEPQDAFLGIIGFDGSIRAQIELAKAAIIYPPHGLPTLLFGESGVGKNLLAESMWNYAKEYWQEKSLGEIPFIQFSCADYAANEQLLLAQLFGYVKGAFTGANEEHEGVVDRAQGGILFLDEIHRLPPSGQELLFMLIDKGVYRRLGETNKTRQSNIMIIGATSEDVSSSLLMTFRRRIPVQITLPRISERPIHERVNIIVHFVRQEAVRLGVPIWISGKVLEIFTNYNCPANIGELRNDVLLCCAKSYLEFSAGRVDCLKLDTGNIPERIFSSVKRHTVLDENINNFFRDGILIQANTDPLKMTEEQHGVHIDFYKYIDRKIAQYRQQGAAQKDMAEKVGSDLEKYFCSVAQVLRKNETSDIPASIIEEIVWETADELLKTAAEQFGRTYGRNTLLALAWHMQQFKERIASGRIIYNPNLEHIRSAHREAFALVAEYKEKISTQLEVDVSDDEIGFMVMFLIHGAEEYAKAHVGLVIVAHGRGIAYSMAEVTNNLLGTDCIKAYDIPLSRSNVQTIEDLRKVIQEADEGLGVVLLVDMGFLVTMEDTLCQKTGVQVRIIPNVTTALALEAARRLFTTAESLDVSVKAIYDAYDEYVMTIRQRHETNEFKQKEKQEQKNILLVCATGQGVANKIKEILLSEIPEIKNARFIMAGAVDDIKKVVADTGERLDFIIGSINPHVDHVPFVPVSELFEHGGVDRIKKLFQKKYGVQKISSDLKVRKNRDTYKLLETQLNKFVKALSIEKVARCCMELVDAVSEHFFAGEMEEDCVVRIYLHAACMFDRIYTKEALQEPPWSLKIQQEREKDFKCLKQIVSVCGEKLSLQIPTGEICYFLGSLPVLDKERGMESTI